MRWASLALRNRLVEQFERAFVAGMRLRLVIGAKSIQSHEQCLAATFNFVITVAEVAARRLGDAVVQAISMWHSN